MLRKNGEAVKEEGGEGAGGLGGDKFGRQAA